jgi:hypothetical protein
MATAETIGATRRELTAQADYGAGFGELIDQLDEQNRRLGRSGFSDEQEEELQLFCWALRKGQSSGVRSGPARVWEGLEDDIGA